MVVWVSFPEKYQLQDVQAGLNVAIAILSASGIFVFVRFCWQLGAAQVAKKRNVPVYSLLSLNTVGEVWDIIWLLKRDLLTKHYLLLLAQCVVVLTLTVCTILSGFIARFSTRNGYITEAKDINGTLAVRNVSAIYSADAEWNQTLTNIIKAKFPTDQLLEYLPNPDSNWMYHQSQWNSSWTMKCNYTDQTPLQLENTGNCTDSDIFNEISGLNDVIDPDAWDDWAWDSTDWAVNNTLLRDVLFFLHAESWGVGDQFDNKTSSYTNMTILTAAVHMHNMPTNTTIQPNCTFAKGPIGPSSYTMMACNLTRNLDGDDPKVYGAFPDFADLKSISNSYTTHFATRFRQESSRDRAITTISGPELAQFYQAYSVIRDAAIGPFTTRSIDVSVQVPQVSLSCLIICSIGVVLVLLGFGNYSIFIYRRWDVFTKTPESKLDWMLATIQAGGANRNSARQKLRNSMTSSIEDDTLPLRPVQASGSMMAPGAREDFEGATWLPYRTPSVRTAASYMSPSLRSATSYTSLQAPRSNPYVYTDLDDTSYDPVQRPTSLVQPIEDGYFQKVDYR